MTGWLLRAVGVLLMASALALVLSRAPDWPAESLVARWAPRPSDFIDVGGQTVHIRDEGPRGDPVPVVLLHGMAASLHTWEGWAAALKTQRRVITLDLPGSGLTGPGVGDGTAGGAVYTPAADARFVLAVLDALQVRRFVAGGNGLGGGVALRLALLAPARVDRLVLMAPDGWPAAPTVLPVPLRLLRLPFVGWLFENVLPRPLVAMAVAGLPGDPARATPALVDRYVEMTLRQGNRRALVQRLRQSDAADDDAGRADPQAAALRLPTLILWGALDRVAPPAGAQALQAAIAGSRLVVFDGLGHIPQEEDPARTVAAVQAFLAGR